MSLSWLLECRLRLRWQAKLPLLLTPLTYIPVGKACTPAPHSFNKHRSSFSN